ncbi:hypothetical protein NHX12_003594 [Muraenolepis orangiensis]|uniref:Leucine-rich repeat-containing protein 56 n=1 Tax=Muraenolepis orangiensis TaxID=630683 RepID=A0A9Q0DZC4_9TELE|nr:hypothetical protein NHX12_003594 [Muraenolepis orangiensis]
MESGCEGPLAQKCLGRAVRVTEMVGPGALNPAPAKYEDLTVEIPLSPAMLRSVCGTEDLSQITSLEICIDTRQCTLGNIGAYLPRLVELKLNNSTMVSVRDLGSTLAHLQVLWLSRCGLRDLDGIIPFTHLQELYMAYNGVSDLSQLSMLDQLQVLDAEGNDVDDLVQVQNLALCSQLHTLSLEGNPVCALPHPTASQGLEYSYRVAVRELVPQLRYLDDVRVEEAGPGSISSTMGDEWSGKILFCGNPVQALRARREKLRTAPASPWGPPPRPPLYVPEHTYDLEEPGRGERSDVLADLCAWREQHAKRLQLIEEERRPEVLKVDHGDEEDDDDDDEEEEDDDDDDDDDDDEEDLGDESSEECEDQPQREALSSPDMARLLTPLPPTSPSSSSSSYGLLPGCHGDPQAPGVRTQRLRLLPASRGTLGVSGDIRQQEESGTPRAGPGLWAPRGLEEGRPMGNTPPGSPRALTAPVPPTTRPLARRHRNQQ